MPKVETPKSNFLNAGNYKEKFFDKDNNLKKEYKEEDTYFVIKTPFVEPVENADKLTGDIENKHLGLKQIYDFKSKLSDLFDSFGDNTDNWVGQLIKPIPQQKGDFFRKFEVISSTTQDIKD